MHKEEIHEIVNEMNDELSHRVLLLQSVYTEK